MRKIIRRIALAMIGLVSMASCITIDPIEKSCCYITYLKNTSDDPILVTSKFYPINFNENPVLTSYKDSLILIEPGEIKAVMDYTPPAYIEIFSTEDTTFIVSESMSVPKEKGVINERPSTSYIEAATPIVVDGKMWSTLGVKAERYLYEFIDWDYYSIVYMGNYCEFPAFNSSGIYENGCPGYAVIRYYEIDAAELDYLKQTL